MKKILLLAICIAPSYLFSQPATETFKIANSDDIIERKIDEKGTISYSWDNNHVAKTVNNVFGGFQLVKKVEIIPDDLAKQMFLMYDDLYRLHKQSN